MGWFDDDDSSDSDSDNQNHQKALETSQIGTDSQEADPLDMYMVGITETAASEARETAKKEVVNQNDDDDPLDAYMKSLSSTTPKSSSGGRLDMDADEEATSHWHEHTAGNNSSMPRETEASLNEDCANTQSFAHSLEGMAAKSALAESFQMSGTYKKKIVEHDDETGLKRKHQEITPLERLDHTGIAYEPFCKIFLTSPQNTEMGIRWRQEETVTCQPSQWDPMTTFEDLNGVFPQELLEAISSAKFETPTPVQSQTLPVTLAGRDVLVTASTGSGKTLAFVWPMVVHCNDQPHIDPKVNAGPIGLILTPTRELAQQVYKHVKKMVRSIGGTAVAVTGGGKGRYELVKELQKGCEIVVATPGRLIDVLGNKSHLSLRRVTMLVLDEADKMLDMGFESQVSSIMDNVRPDRQTLLFSATFGKKVERVARNWLQNPVRIAVGKTGTASEHVTQHVLVLPSYHAKKQWIMEMLPTLAGLGRMIVFVASRADCDEICQAMQASPAIGGKGLAVSSIHGDKDQRDRNAALSALKKGKLAALVATDVASRGLDVPDIQTVVNFDAAKNLDSHVHRIGRAGRLQVGSDAGQQKGIAYTLLTPKNADFANTLADAFYREGREVTDELLTLARKSKQHGGQRSKWNKTGLGFGDNDAKGSSSAHKNAAIGSGHYGPCSAGSNRDDH